MISVSVKLDEASIREAQHILRAIPKGWPRAAHRALTRTAKSGKTSLSRIIRHRMGGKAKDIKNLIYVHYPSFANLRTTLEISDFNKQIIDLNAQQTGEGVTYEPSFGGRRQLIRHAFIATGQSRGRQVWLRSRYHMGRAKMIDWKGRRMEAIIPQRESGIRRFVKAEDLKQVQKEGEVNLIKNIQHEVEVQLKGWAKKGKY